MTHFIECVPTGDIQLLANESTVHSPQPAGSSATQPSDPFANLQSLRLSQDFGAMAGVKPVITTVAVRKPGKQEFVRVRPGTEWRFDTCCFFDAESDEIYLVAPELRSVLGSEAKPTLLAVSISRNSPVPFLWPLALPNSDGRPCRWHDSALEAAGLAERSWIKVVSDRSASCYVPHVATGNLGEPSWPDDLTLTDLLRLAFAGRFIASTDHPILRRLRGEA